MTRAVRTDCRFGRSLNNPTTPWYGGGEENGMAVSRVAIAACTDYEPEGVYRALRDVLEPLGGPGAFVRRGERILLKPNLLFGYAPERATTTHPAFFDAAIRIFREAGATLTWGDSPGYGTPAAAARKAGLTEVAERHGIPMADFEHGETVDFPDGRVCREFLIASGARDCDGIVTLPKMKTHGLTRITAAVKNQLGCVPGFHKARSHMRHSHAHEFSRMLVDLNRLLRPRLALLDGIVAMEGNGPSGGDPVALGVVVASADPVAADATFCRIVDLDPSFVPTITFGEEDGLGFWKEGQIEYLGEPIERFRRPSFRVSRSPVRGDSVLRPLRPLRNWILPRPVIDASRCVRCGICVDACPVPEKAVRFGKRGKSRPPEYRYAACIRCYCCQEMCPHHAISIATSLPGRLFGAG